MAKRWYCKRGDGCHIPIGLSASNGDGDGQACAATRSRLNVYLAAMLERAPTHVMQAQAVLLVGII